MTANGDFDLMSTTEVNGTNSDRAKLFCPAESSAKLDSIPDRQAGRVLPMRQWYLPLKWICEYVLAMFLFLISIPILILAAICIKATSKGPVFYLQTRVGKQGKLFRVIKLRTMVNNAELKTGPVWSTQNDPRITPIGKFLRDTHIDEFPQLMNVLMGRMALVGPRPERPEIVRELEWKISSYSERSNVRPGITGFSQMMLPADSDLESVRRKQIFDLYYVTHVSPWFDIRILANTGWVLARALFRGALSIIALPSPVKVMTSLEAYASMDSDLLVAEHNLPPK
jgi:lipopolysaccharide/colanic/teichoic acid biosynthesis glycosyltransferase